MRNTVVMDLEFCSIKNKALADVKKICGAEVIQFGAVKLNEENQIVDRFDQLVRPQYCQVDPSTRNLTHISMAMLAHARGYTEVMRDFMVWAEGCDVYSWSNSDLTQLKRENQLKGIPEEACSDLFSHWYDLQKIIGQKLEAKNPISLSNALSGCGIIYMGNQHSALDDAENTAMLYQLMQDEEGFRAKMASTMSFLEPTEDLTYSLGSLFSGLSLGA